MSSVTVTQRLRDENQNDIEVRLDNLSSFEIKLM